MPFTIYSFWFRVDDWKKKWIKKNYHAKKNEDETEWTIKYACKPVDRRRCTTSKLIKLHKIKSYQMFSIRTVHLLHIVYWFVNAVSFSKQDINNMRTVYARHCIISIFMNLWVFLPFWNAFFFFFVLITKAFFAHTIPLCKVPHLIFFLQLILFWCQPRLWTSSLFWSKCIYNFENFQLFKNFEYFIRRRVVGTHRWLMLQNSRLKVQAKFAQGFSIWWWASFWNCVALTPTHKS